MRTAAAVVAAAGGRPGLYELPGCLAAVTTRHGAGLLCSPAYERAGWAADLIGPTPGTDTVTGRGQGDTGSEDQHATRCSRDLPRRAAAATPTAGAAGCRPGLYELPGCLAALTTRHGAGLLCSPAYERAWRAADLPGPTAITGAARNGEGHSRSG